MKMVIAIVKREDSGKVCGALLENGYQYTTVAATGGFLKTGNTTLLIGVEDSRVDDAIGVIRGQCSQPTKGVSASPEEKVSGTVIFVTDVAQFVKM